MSGPSEPPGELPRVGYLGPQGTFSEEALLASVRGETVEAVALASIYDTIAALREGFVRWAIVPIENSLEGSIAVTLDELAGEPGGLEVVGEAVLRVRHALIAAQPLALGEIETVMTHPQVPGQCTRLLREELAGARVLPASSTAEAVRAVVAEGRSGASAIGTLLAAQIYGASVIRSGVEDREDNETRFVWLARTGERERLAMLREPDPEWKTSLVFWGLGAAQPGWLVQCLEEFSGREINLTKIESRPRRERLGSYMFFADLAGRREEPRLAAAIEGVRALCEE
ncbi:MAG: prephenate dehydratase, partial [Solirubrobacterales bacterium]|nr:prephenate dehydratase [Solirubrobacterales bacterium]